LYLHTGRKKCISSTVYLGILRALLSECEALLSNFFAGLICNTHQEKEVRFLDSVLHIVKERIHTSLFNMGPLYWAHCVYLGALFGEYGALLNIGLF